MAILVAIKSAFIVSIPDNELIVLTYSVFKLSVLAVNVLVLEVIITAPSHNNSFVLVYNVFPLNDILLVAKLDATIAFVKYKGAFGLSEPIELTDNVLSVSLSVKEPGVLFIKGLPSHNNSFFSLV